MDVTITLGAQCASIRTWAWRTHSLQGQRVSVDIFAVSHEWRKQVIGQNIDGELEWPHAALHASPRHIFAQAPLRGGLSCSYAAKPFYCEDRDPSVQSVCAAETTV
jgi:hypothetical protein